MLIRYLLIVIFLRIFVAGLFPTARTAVNSAGLLAALILSILLVVRLRRVSTKIVLHPVLYLPPLCMVILFLDLTIDPEAQISLAINELFRVVSYVLLFISLSTYLHRLPEMRQISMLRLVSKWAAYLAISLSAYGIFKYLQGNTFVLSSGFAETAQYNEFADGLAVNPNAFGGLLTLTISGLMFAPKKIMSPLLKYIALIMAIFAILLSGSRTSILALALAFSAPVMRRPKYLLPLVILSSIAAVFLATQAVEIQVKSNTSISWRLATWDQLLNDMNLQHFLFGKGPGEVERFLVTRDLWVVTEPHNDYLRMTYFYGLGGLLYFSIIFRPKPTQRWRREIAFQLTPTVFAFLTLSLAENIFRDSNASLVALVWLAYRNGLAGQQAKGPKSLIQNYST